MTINKGGNLFSLSHRYCPDGMTIEEWQVALRRQYARESSFIVEHTDNNRIWGDYSVKSGNNRYRVAFRGVRSEGNYCSCLDFRTNALGTCKHIEAVIQSIAQEVDGYPWAGLSFMPDYSSIYVCYKEGRSIKLFVGADKRKEFMEWSRKYFDADSSLYPHFYRDINLIVEEAQRINREFRCYDDVYNMIENFVAQEEWTNYVLTKESPEHCIPLPKLGVPSKEIQYQLYSMLRRGYGFIISKITREHRYRILSLMAYVLKHKEGRALVVCQTDENVEKWKNLIHDYIPEPQRVELVTAKQIQSADRKVNGFFAFVYVEEAKGLNEWKNMLSVSLKKLAIGHLFIHLTTLSDLTAMQFSSIAQHISPYLLGPLYLFVRDNRPLFPLNDDGSNLPEKLKPFVFFQPQDDKWQNSSSVRSLSPQEQEEQEIRNFLQQFSEIISDPDKLQILQKVLRKTLEDK